MDAKDIKERQYDNSKALWTSVLAVDSILLATKNIFDKSSILSIILFNAFIIISAFLIILNFYHFRKVQNDKLEYKTSRKPNKHYDYHTSIMTYSIKTEIASFVFILLAVAVWIQNLF